MGGFQVINVEDPKPEHNSDWQVLAEEESKAPDIFDQVATDNKATVASPDIFDEVAKSPEELKFENAVARQAISSVPKPRFLRPIEPGEKIQDNETREEFALRPLSPEYRAQRQPVRARNVAAGLLNLVTTPELSAVSNAPNLGTQTVEGAENVATPGKRVKGAAQLVSAGGEALSPLMGPAALENPAPLAIGLGTGMAASEGAGRVTKAAGGSPEAQELARQIGFWVPSLAGTVLGLHGGAEVSPEGTRAAVTGFKGKVGAGVAVTPDEVVIRGGIGSKTGEIRIPRGGAATPETPAIEPPTIDASDIAAATASMNAAKDAETQAQMTVRGVAPTPAPAPEPAPAHISPQVVSAIGSSLVNLPEADRAQAIIQAHGELSENLQKAGKVIAPDGTLQVIKSPDQADKLAQSIINSEITRQDSIAKEAQKEPETKPVEEPASKKDLNVAAGRAAAKKALQWQVTKEEPANGNEYRGTSSSLLEDTREVPAGSGGTVRGVHQGTEEGNPSRSSEMVASGNGREPEWNRASVEGNIRSGESASGEVQPAARQSTEPFQVVGEEPAPLPFAKNDRVQIEGVETPATVKHMSTSSGIGVLRLEFDKPTQVPWSDKALTRTAVPGYWQDRIKILKEEPRADKLDLVTDESGAFEPGKLGAALVEAAGPIRDYLRNEIEQNARARKLHAGMYDLEEQHQATVLRAVQAMEQVTEELGDKAPADMEAVYHHLEDATSPLTPQQEHILDDVVLPIMDDTESSFVRLQQLLGKSPNLMDSYVHRVVKGKGGWLDQIAHAGNGDTGSLLSKSAPQTKSRSMMALEPVEEEQTFPNPPQGQLPERKIVSIKGGQFVAWKNGQPEELDLKPETQDQNDQVKQIDARIKELEKESQILSATPSRTGVTFERRKNITEEIDKLEDDRDAILGRDATKGTYVDEDGQRWKLTQATTKEIEANTDLEYYKNALASALVSNIQVTKALRGAEFIESFKSDPDFKEIAVHRDQRPPAGWKTTELPQLRDYYFEPHTAEVLNWYAERLKGKDPSIFDEIGRFLRTSIFFNPLLHIPNISIHWGIEKGITGYTPEKWQSSYKAGVKAINAVVHQNQDFLDALDAGAPLQSQREKVSKFSKLLFEQLAGSLEKKEPMTLRIAKAIGMSPVTLTKALYDFSGKATWTVNDIAFLQAAYEKVERGSPLKEALTETAKHIPDYRLPTRILNSPAVAKVMSNPSLTLFGGYHYSALKSYGEMAKSALGIGEEAGRSKVGEVGHGLDLLAALGIVTFIVYPLLDKLAQKASGDEKAHVRRAGAATFPSNLVALARGDKTLTEVIESVVTPAVHTKTAAEMVLNRDLRNGREIYDPHADWHTQVQQIGRRLAESISPIQQASRVAEGGPEARRRFLYGLIGISFPKSAAEKLASEMALEKMGTAAESPEDREKYSLRHEILLSLRKGDEKPLSEALAKSEITYRQAYTLRQRARLTPLQDAVRNFGYKDLWRVYQHADPEEKKQLNPLLRRRRAELFKSRTPDTESE